MPVSTSTHSVGDTDAACACGVAAYAVVESTFEGLAALREASGPVAGREIPPRFLRNADEQTVVGLTAVLRAIQRLGRQAPCFDEWGVLAAPRFPGRIGCAAAQVKYRQGGPSTISPHVIPQCSLHSLSSAVSIALAMRGPNFGVGGGPEALAEGLAAALGLLDCDTLPGLWLVLTGWDPEAAPDGQGSITNDAVCRGVALALVPGERADCPIRLAVPVSRQPLRRYAGDAGHEEIGPTAASELMALAEWLAGDEARPRAGQWTCNLPWGGRIELTRRRQQQLWVGPTHLEARAA